MAKKWFVIGKEPGTVFTVQSDRFTVGEGGSITPTPTPELAVTFHAIPSLFEQREVDDDPPTPPVASKPEPKPASKPAAKKKPAKKKKKKE